MRVHGRIMSTAAGRRRVSCQGSLTRSTGAWASVPWFQMELTGSNDVGMAMVEWPLNLDLSR